MKYLTHTIEPWMPIGATKPKNDIAAIAQETGYQIIEIDRATQGLDASLLTVNLTSADLVIHQFPSYLPLEFEENFQQSVQKTGAKFVVFIHDFEPLRLSGRPDEKREYGLLQRSDGIVVHTPEMADRLDISHVPTFYLGLFDYLSLAEIPRRHPSERLIFAGTLSKASWLQQFHQPIDVFGQIPRKWRQVTLPDQIHFHDLLPQDTAPTGLPDGVGLVWDSDMTDETQYQQYQMLNSPHKLSLYLAADLPVIVPSFSPFSSFITDHKLGASISDLSELPAKFDYDSAFAQKIGQDLRTGKQTKKLLQKLEQFFDQV
ncbi:hypothetical protein [Pseudolactococcus insecticola]|uniref:Glycosyltransferase n=1 Tax=Pseudolactococcus insecticola TaxID=2709158 RepID=A0A6A0B420_9LACT|nr:hypothetical protein [Lactococcus insecticola]GFH40070.1 hypothetical protein Hs20B_04680 [Lactococcus insecticola]